MAQVFDIAQIGSHPLIALVFKIGILVILAMYTLFLLVILKQIRSMNTIITQPNLFPIIQTALIFLIGLTVFLIVAGIVVL